MYHVIVKFPFQASKLKIGRTGILLDARMIVNWCSRCWLVFLLYGVSRSGVCVRPMVQNLCEPAGCGCVRVALVLSSVLLSSCAVSMRPTCDLRDLRLRALASRYLADHSVIMCADNIYIIDIVLCDTRLSHLVLRDTRFMGIE